MTRFCADCGGPLDRRGRCRRCGWVAPDAPVAPPSAKAGKAPKTRAAAAADPRGYPYPPAPPAKSKRRGLKIGLIIAAVIVVLLLLVVLLQALNVLHIPFLGKLLGQEEYQSVDGNPYADDPYNNPHMITPPDADAYFAQHGEVRSKQPAGSSTTVRSEAEVTTELENRGIAQYPITADYDMSGNLQPTQISASGSAKHPMYTTYYQTQQGDIWVILDVNGSIFAQPMSYNNERADGGMVILSETDSVISYDSTSNSFFNTRPYQSSMTVKTVTRIDAELLESLDQWEIDGL